jgi:UDP-glucose 4-epimerase
MWKDSDMKWLVTGGAGYIGSHLVAALLNQNHEVAVIDNLHSGNRERSPADLDFHNTDIRDHDHVEKIIAVGNFDGIFHMAALKSVQESIRNSQLYYEINTRASLRLFEIATKHKVPKVIFSSTAAVYSSHGNSFKNENDIPDPDSPYGKSKRAAEVYLLDCVSKGLFQGTSLRFFNVIGSLGGSFREVDGENLLPKVANQVKSGGRPIIFGSDYKTKDGTCVRDFVDVRDIANAHLLSAISPNLPPYLNIGTGVGSTVLEVVREITNYLGVECSPIFAERREGDVESMVADISLARESIKYFPSFSLSESVEGSLKLD